MYRWGRSLPDGMRDYLFKDAARKRKLERAFGEVFKKRGYNEIITPAIEFYDVFRDEAESVPQEDLYKLFDARGRILALATIRRRRSPG